MHSVTPSGGVPELRISNFYFDLTKELLSISMSLIMNILEIFIMGFFNYYIILYEVLKFSAFILLYFSLLYLRHISVNKMC